MALLEIMLTPVPPANIIKMFLDLSLLRESHHVGVSALTMHAIGLIIPLLPQEEFVRPIFQELNDMIETNIYLQEISEPCRLVSVQQYITWIKLLILPKKFHNLALQSDSMRYTSKCERKIRNDTVFARSDDHSSTERFHERKTP